MLKDYENVPIIGIVLKNGEVISYNQSTAAKYNYHHSFIVMAKAIKPIDYDDALRFVKLLGEDYYTLEGEPALNPFNAGKKMISIFAKHCIENGVNPNARIKIKDHKLGTYYEGLFVGRLLDFLPKE